MLLHNFRGATNRGLGAKSQEGHLLEEIWYNLST